MSFYLVYKLIVTKRTTRYRTPDHKARPWTTRATFAEDGSVAFSVLGLFEYIVRGIYAFTLFLLAQLPFKVFVNGDRFFSAFSTPYRNTAYHLGPWVNGPGWRPRDAPIDVDRFIECDDDLVSQDERREALFAQFDAYATKMGRHIPRVVHHGKVTPEPAPSEDVEMEELEPNAETTPDNDNVDLSDDDEEGWETYDLDQFKKGHGGGGRPKSKSNDRRSCSPMLIPSTARIAHPAPKKLKPIVEEPASGEYRHA